MDEQQEQSAYLEFLVDRADIAVINRESYFRSANRLGRLDIASNLALVIVTTISGASLLNESGEHSELRSHSWFVVLMGLLSLSGGLLAAIRPQMNWKQRSEEQRSAAINWTKIGNDIIDAIVSARLTAPSPAEARKAMDDLTARWNQLVETSPNIQTSDYARSTRQRHSSPMLHLPYHPGVTSDMVRVKNGDSAVRDVAQGAP